MVNGINYTFYNIILIIDTEKLVLHKVVTEKPCITFPCVKLPNRVSDLGAVNKHISKV